MTDVCVCLFSGVRKHKAAQWTGEGQEWDQSKIGELLLKLYYTLFYSQYSLITILIVLYLCSISGGSYQSYRWVDNTIFTHTHLLEE